jgi:predicted RNA-binding Zn-ribbon protein involved in translation (DUF1610 family)
MGIDDSSGRPMLKRTTKRAVPTAETTDTRCVACGEVMHGEAATTRHMGETGHHRYECVLD